MPEPTSEGKEREIATNPFADAFEAGAEEKHSKVDLEKEVPFYPSGTAEIADSGSEEYKKYAAPLLEKLAKEIKGREPRHLDKAALIKDNYAYYLLIDENASPKERVFKSKEPVKGEEYKETATRIPQENLEKIFGRMDKKLDDFQEDSKIPQTADVVKRAKDDFKKAKGHDMANEDASSAFDAADYEYVVVMDQSDKQKPYRVFKSKEPIPA